MQSKSTFLDNVFLDANLAPLTKIIQVQMMFCLKCWCTWLLNLTFSLCRVLACFITGLLIGCGKKGKFCSIFKGNYAAKKVHYMTNYAIFLKLIFLECKRTIKAPKIRARKIFEFHLARWASNSHILLAQGPSPLAQVFKLINNS